MSLPMATLSRHPAPAGRRLLNADAIAALLARGHLTFKQAMDKLVQTTGQDSSATVRRLNQAAFGIDDLAATPSTGPPRPSPTATRRTG